MRTTGLKSQVTLKPNRKHGAGASRPRATWMGLLCFAAVLWLMLWAAINSGPWVFQRTPEGLREWVHYVRTAFPMAVLVAALFVGRGGARGKQARGLPGPIAMWLLYGLVGFGASFLSPRPLDAAYWGAAYLAVFTALAAYLRGGDPLRRAVELNWLTWAATTGILAILCIFARHMLYAAAQTSMSHYGFVGSVGEMPVIRTSGMARFAAVPAVLAYVMLWCDRVLVRRLFWGALFAAAGVLIYMMQARGTSFSLAFALVAASYALGVRARAFGIAVALMATLAIAVEVVPRETVDRIASHITRGQSVEEMRGMTGRTGYWEQALKRVPDSPMVGFGFQADRTLEIGHIHNTYLYVLLTAGLVGLAAFVMGLGWAWLGVWDAIKRNTAARLGQQAVFAQCVGIVAFFTMRSIPEVSGGMFGVDQMVMLPAMVYLALLARKRPAARRAGGQRAEGGGQRAEGGGLRTEDAGRNQ